MAELNELELAEMLACLRRSGREVMVVDYDGETGGWRGVY